MLIHFGTDLLHPEWTGSVVAIGTFDGVHIGHRKVIESAVQLAQERELPSIVVTFDRHPSRTLKPEFAPLSLQSLDQNLAHMARCGVSLCVVLPFDQALAKTSAEDFLHTILEKNLKAVSLCVGHDFAMGHDRKGDTEWLTKHISTTVVPPFELDGQRVSSSAIRRHIAEGNVGDAANMLGRPFSINGVVVSGEKLGRQLGFPTMNLALSFEHAVPRIGIYAGLAKTQYGNFVAAISIGIRPTVNGRFRTIEAFLLDYPGHSLYASAVELEIHHRLRDEEKYDSLEALTTQIHKDVEQTRLLMSS